MLQNIFQTIYKPRNITQQNESILGVTIVLSLTLCNFSWCCIIQAVELFYQTFLTGTFVKMRWWALAMTSQPDWAVPGWRKHKFHWFWHKLLSLISNNIYWVQLCQNIRLYNEWVTIPPNLHIFSDFLWQTLKWLFKPFVNPCSKNSLSQGSHAV